MTEREDARDLIFTYVLPMIDGEFGNAITAFPGTIRSIDDVVAGMDAENIPQTFRVNLSNALASRRAGQAGVDSPLAGVLDAALAWYLKAIGSSYESGGGLISRSGACFDFRASLIANTEYVASMGQTVDTDPTPADGLLLRRLTVDHTGQNIEGGVRETVTFEVTQTAITGAGARTVDGILYGSTGPDDALDRDGGTDRSANISLPVYNEMKRGAVQNSTFALIGAPADTTVIPLDQTILGAPWVQATVTALATVTVTKSNLFRSLTTGIKITGQTTGRKFTQPLVVPAAQGGAPNAYTPIDILAVLYWDGTWEGTATITWGSKSIAYTEADFSGAGFKYLVPDLDEDLYPVNFTTTDPEFVVQVETDSATGFVVLISADVQRMTARQGFFYSAWSQEDDPAEATLKTWDDSNAWTGQLARAFYMAYGQAPFAYLPTDGSSLLTPQVYAPEIAVSYNGANVADGGTIALGSVSTGAHTVTVRVTNSGKGVLAVGVPVGSGGSNATLTGTGITSPQGVAANTDSFLDIPLVVTDGGAGAFSVVATFANNDASEDPYNFTISGTAV